MASNNYVTPVDGKYQVTQNGLYYIGVPLDGNDTAYSGITSANKLGFVIDKENPSKSVDMFAIRLNLYKPDKTHLLERHTMVMVRRVLYHTD